MRKLVLILFSVLALVGATSSGDSCKIITYDGYTVDLLDVLITINPYALAQNVAQYANMLVFAHEGEKLGLKVSEEEIDNYLLTRWDNDELLALQKLVGREKVRKFARLNLLSQKAVEHYRDEVIKEKRITVSDDEIKKFYVEHLKDFTVPKRYKVDILAIDKNANNYEKLTEKVKKLVGQGDLESTAKKLGEEDGITFIKDNIYSEENLNNSLPPDIANKLRSTPVKKVVGPEETPNFVMYFEITEILPEEQKDLNEVKDGIKEKLINDKIRDDLNEKLKSVFDREKDKVVFNIEFFRKLILGEDNG
jgi:parvulin-like peptidyl-prolyl isomerase